ncbi:MAG TPA: GNAT family N-acetyltransferase [Chloroflexia bacterium]|nr:GNAT family N-acetyltransferase [Chloroflexia bacterium]
MALYIRPWTPADYPALVAAHNAAYLDAAGEPIGKITLDELREMDGTRPAHCGFARWVAELDGAVVGAGEYDQAPHRFHPRKFWLELYVHPAYQGHGVGGALYDQVLTALAARDPIVIRTNIRADQERSLGFIQARGWYETGRIWESDLDPAQADLSSFADTDARMAALGVTTHTLPELAADLDRDRKLYDLVWEVRQDLPAYDPPTQEPWDVFLRDRLHHPSIPPDGYFVAVRDGEYLGYVYHRTDETDPGVLHVAQLGTARKARGQGIAGALKVREVRYAQTHGYRRLRTANESHNAPILAINGRLGFVRRPAWIDLAHEFAPGS